MSDYEIKEYKTPEFENANIMVMQDVPEYDMQDYDLFNEKDFKKYIDDIERLVRSSREYRTFVQYLRMYMDMNSSAFLENVNNIDTTKIKIELHHTPFTLFDITLTVFNKRSRLQEPLDMELVAKEVCYIHYFLYVGLIPLSKTEHKLVHNQALFVPLDIVLGKYDEFIEMYKQDIPPDAMERYETYKELTKSYNKAINTKILEVTPTYLKLPGTDPNSLGAYNLPMLEQVLSVTENQMRQLNQKHSHVYNLEDNKYDNTTQMIKPFTVNI